MDSDVLNLDLWISFIFVREGVGELQIVQQIILKIWCESFLKAQGNFGRLTLLWRQWGCSSMLEVLKPSQGRANLQLI